MTMVLETQRLILRPWTEEDAPELYRYASDPRVGPIAGWPVHTSVEHSREIIREVFSAPETYAVVLKETGLPVGSVGILRGEGANAPLGEREAEIGYWIGVPYWGRGLIPEAVDKLLERCFHGLNCTAVWCDHADGNEKSRRVMEKCGFRYHHTVEGGWNDLIGASRTVHYTRLTREEWEAKASGV